MPNARDAGADFGSAAGTALPRASTQVLAIGLWSVFGGLAMPDVARAVSEGSQLAYVDPGAGSFILQAVVAMFAGAIVAANVYWSRIKRFLGLGTDSDDENGDRSDDG